MAFLQATSIATSATVNVLTTPGMTSNTGDFISIGTSILNTGGTANPSDSYNNVWTAHPLSPIVLTGFNDKGYSWYAKNITGGTAHTFTITTTGISNSSIVVCEYTGRALDFPVAATGGGQDSTATSNHGCDLLSFNFTSSTVSENFNTGIIWFIPPNAQNNNGALYQPSFGQISNNVAQGTYSNTWVSSDSVVGGGFSYAIKPPSFTIIQQVQGSTGTGAVSLTLPTSSTVSFTTGNLVLYIAKYTNSAIQNVTITDTLNNTWQQINSYFDASNNTGIAFGFANAIVGGQDNVNMTLAAGPYNYLALYLVEISGLSQTSPFVTGEFVINKVVSPGNGANGIATSFTGNIARRPALLFGFCLDATNTTGQVLSPGTNFNALPGVWTFGLSQNAALPEFQRI
jgi:hypothetical protein